RHDRADDCGDRRDLPDEVAREVNDVRAEVADRARARLCRIESPDALVGLPTPRLEVAGAEVDDLAELSCPDQVAGETDGRHEPVVEAAHMDDPGLLGRSPQVERLCRTSTERLLAEDVEAVADRRERGLRMNRVRAGVVEE